MKRTLYATAAAAMIAAAPVFAANPREPMTPREAVAFMQSKYPGEVTLLRFDRSPLEPAHYHVDMFLPTGSTVKLELDAVTGRIAAVPHTSEQARPAISLAKAIESVNERIEGQVVVAEFDGTTRNDPHYHVDLRLPSGHLIPLRVDRDGSLQWRQDRAY